MANELISYASVMKPLMKHFNPIRTGFGGLLVCEHVGILRKMVYLGREWKRSDLCISAILMFLSYILLQ